MPNTMSRAMAECLRQASRWLESEAALLQSGEVLRVRDGEDESKRYAEELLHRARNLEASAVAFERHLDMEELSTRTKLGTMQNALHGALAVKQHFQTDVAVSSAGDGKAIGVPPIILVER